ncbi:rhomboid family intramembrane serine protease [Bergeyella zoohelcum]|uniref:rhomboid family intramembrane serine protease n=1 Tax=Bergeyella zoohelcum TaxID=1015 RepID=UPI002A90E472|nr:rhomboid family intramembrane serine protease [Bergeyella zoohelcum]MDY6025956.1 rhomboid family intramembrane serine protease [Bergeyella zoohelcum]
MSISIITIAITVIISIIAMNNREVFEKYKFNIGAIKYNKEYIRMISAGFLHADFFHLLFNMYTLYIFSPIILNTFGTFSFLAIYLGSIIAGNLFCMYLYKDQSWYSAIGASGGVSGVLFASIALYPYLGLMIFPIPVHIPGFIFGLLYFGYSVYMMLNPRQGDNIGHAAHIGGAVMGLVFVLIMATSAVIAHLLELIVMALPLFYMGYKIRNKK